MELVYSEKQEMRPISSHAVLIYPVKSALLSRLREFNRAGMKRNAAGGFFKRSSRLAQLPSNSMLNPLTQETRDKQLKWNMIK